jgi:hypothetical protein
MLLNPFNVNKSTTDSCTRILEEEQERIMCNLSPQFDYARRLIACCGWIYECILVYWANSEI